MAGVYFHIPFCRKACTYCDFHFSTNLNGKEALVRAMHEELALRRSELVSPFETIYFGGGTPSLLSKKELKSFIDSVEKTATAEITLEVNPDDVSKRSIDDWLSVGVNRLSIGVQSFFDEQLQFMGRAHNQQQAVASLELISKAGFDSWTLDLIYGLPGLSLDGWKQTIDTALSFSPPHISAYCLTVEERTALHHQVKKGTISLPSNEAQAEQLETLVSILSASAYLQYEISNFAQNDHFAKHNTNYWRRVQYLGIGPSAHSFIGSERRWNVANNVRYIQGVQNNGTYWEQEIIDERTASNERIMTGLRTMWGVDLNSLGSTFNDEQMDTIARYSKRGLLELSPERLVLTPQGRLLADRIASDLFFIE